MRDITGTLCLVTFQDFGAILSCAITTITHQPLSRQRPHKICRLLLLHPTPNTQHPVLRICNLQFAPTSNLSSVHRANGSCRRIWIDLDNSPHVPFFDPIIKELRNRNYEVLLTARDCSQTCGLADLFEMKYRRIGRHYGKKRILKVAGTVFRAAQLSTVMRRTKPSIAVSHGSRAQMISALMLRISSLAIMDYEYVKGFVRPTWIMMPEVIRSSTLRFQENRILKYPGIKEDVYVPSFKPDPTILNDLGVSRDELVVTIRPPATEAHYHNPEAESLFLQAVNRIGSREDSRMVILPRNDEQKLFIENFWSSWCSSKKIIVPENVVDGLNLLWHSDFAISGGGTMNREAAALRVPVYSIFRGKIGDVDRYLVQNGRLVLLESLEDVDTKLRICKRSIDSPFSSTNDGTLASVVGGIVHALEFASG